MNKAQRILLMLIVFMSIQVQVKAYLTESDCEAAEGPGKCEKCGGSWHRAAACNCFSIVQSEIDLEKGSPTRVIFQEKNIDNNKENINWLLLLGVLITGIIIGIVVVRIIKRT